MRVWLTVARVVSISAMAKIVDRADGYEVGCVTVWS